MQKEVDNILVEIPEALPARVGEALSQVRALSLIHISEPTRRS